MMDKLRAASNHVALKIILSIIIVSFVLTGVGGYMFSGSSVYVAKVNDLTISPEQLQRAIQSDRDEMRREYEQQGRVNEFDALMNNQVYAQQHYRQVLDQLIDEVLIRQYVDKLHISISDEQVKTAIRTDAKFQDSNNQFSNDLYRQYLYNIGAPGDWYAQYLRRELESSQLRTLYSVTDFVLPGELDAMTALLLQKRQIRIANVDINALKAQQDVTDEDLAAAYQQNKAQFSIPERYRVAYVEIDAAKVKKDLQISDDEVKAYYDNNLNRFSQSARYNYSVIQVNTIEDANALLEQLKNGADFAVLAKEKSLDPISADQQGELGWFDASTLLDEMKQANLQDKGQVSEPIKSGSSYLLLKLNDVVPAQVQPLTEVATTIKQQLLDDNALSAYFALQQKVGDALTSDQFSFAEVEKIPGINVVETDWFTRASVPEALAHEILVNKLFSGALNDQPGLAGMNNDLIQVEGDRAYALRVLSHDPETFKPLAEVRDIVVDLAKQQKAVTLAQSQITTALSELNAGKSEDEVLKAFNGKFSEPEAVSRQDIITNQALASIISTTFDMALPTDKKPSYAMSNNSNAVALIAFDRVVDNDVSDEMKTAYKKQLNIMNNNLMYSALLANLRKQAKIDIQTTSSEYNSVMPVDELK